jgi:hypothetical protein
MLQGVCAMTKPADSKKGRLKSRWLVGVIAGLAIAITLVSLLFTSANCWKKWGVAKIILNGQASPNSIVYRSRDGTIMLYLKESASDTPQVYVIELDNHKVGIPPGNNINLLQLPGCVYSIHGYPLTVPLDGTAEKMDRFDAMLSAQPGYFEFTSLHGKRLRVEWGTAVR